MAQKYHITPLGQACLDHDLAQIKSLLAAGDDPNKNFNHKIKILIPSTRTIYFTMRITNVWEAVLGFDSYSFQVKKVIYNHVISDPQTKEIIKLLVQAGADMNLIAIDNLTIPDWFFRYGDENMSQFFLTAGYSSETMFQQRGGSKYCRLLAENYQK